MSSPIVIDRSVSPTSSNAGSSYSSMSLSTSTSSTAGSIALVYSREELLNLAMSPLAQSYAPFATLCAFPQLLRRRRCTPSEARRTLEHSRLTRPLDTGVPMWRMNAQAISAPSLTESPKMFRRSPTESLCTKGHAKTHNRGSGGGWIPIMETHRTMNLTRSL